MSKNRLWYSITSLFIIFLHFSPVNIQNVSISLLFLSLPLWNLKTFRFRQVSEKRLIVAFIFLMLPFINLSFDDISEFLKTYILYAVFITQIFILWSFKLKYKNTNIDLWNKYIRYTQYIVIFYSLIQFILFKYYGDPILYNPWKSYQAFNEYNYSLYINSVRATGFYLEPSVLGLAIVMLFWIRHIIDMSIKRDNFFITIVGLYVTNSFSAYISFFIIFIFYFYYKNKKIYIKLISLLFLIYFLFNNMQDIPRINEYSIEGSSTYWRFVAPTIILKDLIPNNIFGLSLGSYEDIVRSYGLYNGASIGSSIDNGHLLFVYYFGILYIFVIFLLLILFVKNNNYIIRSYIVYYFMLYNFTGAIFNIEYIYLIIVLPIITIKMTKEKYDSRRHSNNYIQ